MKKKLIAALLCSVTLFGVVGCENNSNNLDENNTNDFDLKEVMKQDNYVIIDVREKDEYDEEHVKGAVNIPLSNIGDVDYSKDTTLLVYCRSGARSSKAYDTLTSMGYTVYNLGGISEIDLEKE